MGEAGCPRKMVGGGFSFIHNPIVDSLGFAHCASSRLLDYGFWIDFTTLRD